MTLSQILGLMQGLRQERDRTAAHRRADELLIETLRHAADSAREKDPFLTEMIVQAWEQNERWYG